MSLQPKDLSDTAINKLVDSNELPTGAAGGIIAEFAHSRHAMLFRAMMGETDYTVTPGINLAWAVRPITTAVQP